MAEQLEIKVGADTAAAVKAFKQLRENIDAAMKGGEQSMKRFVDSYQKMGVASGKTGEAVKRTGKDFTNLNRIIQDLPYGFIAIQNNLQGIVPAAGAAGVAFNLLLSGLTFASVGLQNWIRGNKDSKGSVTEHLDKVRELRQQMEDYVEALDDSVKARVRGSQNAQEEIVKLETLYKASQNSNIPLKERKKLVDELQEQYPKYFKNISDETILAGGASEAYKKLSKAILQSARARAAQDQLVELKKQEIALEQQLIDGQTKELRASNTLNKAKGRYSNAQKESAQLGQAAVGYVREIAKAEENLGGVVKENTKIYKELNAIRERGNLLSQDIMKNIEENGADVLLKAGKKLREGSKAQFNFFDQFFDTVPDKNRVEQQIVQMAKVARDFAIKNQHLFEGLSDIIYAPSDAAARDAGLKFWDAYQKKIVLLKPPKIELKDLTILPEVRPEEGKKFIDQCLNSIRRGFEQQGDKEGLNSADLFFGEKAFQEWQKQGGRTATQLQEQLKAFKERLQSIAADFGEGVTFSIGEAIGIGLSGGNFQNIFQPIFNIIGSFMQEVGKQMIAASSAMAALKKVLASLFVNPIAGIAAGVGLVALGAVIKNSFKNVRPFAEGGVVFGPTMGLIGEGKGTNRSNPEIVAPLDKLKNFIGGAGGSMNLHGEFVVRGKDLVYVLAQNNLSQGRRF